MRKLGVVIGVLIGVAYAYAQQVTDGTLTQVQDISPGTSLLLELTTKYPTLSSILLAIGGLRLILKPVFSFVKVLADKTRTKRDNEILQDLEKSKIVKVLSYLVDYLGSVKFPVK
jgi:hypothetical protein